MKENNEKNEIKESDYICYKKVNIIGDYGVGKSTLISLLKDNSEDNRKKLLDDSKIYERTISSVSEYSSNESLSDSIQKIKLDKEPLYLNIYETNLNEYDYIKMNLDTLLFQTQYIILMCDNSDFDSFTNIKDFIFVIVTEIKEKKIKQVPIILIRNKMDLKTRSSDEEEKIVKEYNKSIEEIENKYKDYITSYKLSLLNNDNNFDKIQDIISKINEYFKSESNSVKINLNPISENLFEEKEDNKLHCAIIGDSKVGRTTFLNNIFEKGKEEIKSRNFSSIIDDKKFFIKLKDFAGQEEFKSQAKNYLRDLDGILLMFDVTSVQSLENIEQWISLIQENTEGNEVLLIGNKIDENDKRVIKKTEAKAKAEKYKIPYYECSALKGFNVYEILTELISTGYNNYYQKLHTIKKSKTIRLTKDFLINQEKKKAGKGCCPQ